MITKLIVFELRNALRRPYFWFACLCFGLAGAVLPTRGASILAHGMQVNTPGNVVSLIGLASLCSLLIAGGLVAGLYVEDFTAPRSTLLFSLPIRTQDFILSRIAVGAAVIFGPILTAVAGFALAVNGPWADSSKLVPFSAWPFVFGLFVYGLTNALTGSAAFLVLAGLSRRVESALLGLVALLCLQWGAQELFKGFPVLNTALDAIGTRVFSAEFLHAGGDAASYIPTLTPGIAMNRATWLTIAAVCALLSGWHMRRQTRIGKPRMDASDDHPSSWAETNLALRVRPARALTQARSIFAVTSRTILRDPLYWSALAMGLMVLALAHARLPGAESPAPQPLTASFAAPLFGIFAAVHALVLLIYSLELRTRDARLNYDRIARTLPVSSGTWLAGWTMAIAAISAIFQACAVLFSIFLEAVLNPSAVDLMAFTQIALISWAEPLLLGLMALSLSCFARTPGGARAAIGAMVLLKFAVGSFGTRVAMLTPTWLPDMNWSDLLGYDLSIRQWMAYASYWAIVALSLLALASRFGAQGPARAKAGGPVTAFRTWAWAPSAAAIVMGCMLHFSHANRARDLNDAERVEYEQAYRQLTSEPQPRIVAVTGAIVLDPSAYAARADLTYRLSNDTGTPITHVFLDWDPQMEVDLGSQSGLANNRLGFAEVVFPEPMLPGTTHQIHVGLRYRHDRESTITSVGYVTPRGALLRGPWLLPLVGYNPMKELRDPIQRAKAKVGDMSIDSASAHETTSILHGAAPFELSVTVSAPAGMEVFAPASRATVTTPNFAIVAGKWEKTAVTLSGRTVTVYHHPVHTSGTSIIASAVAGAAEYGAREFGADLVRTMDVVEAPIALQAGEAYPQLTVLSEAQAFLMPTEEQPNLLTEIVAHETAHAWWGIDVVPAFAPGADFLTETLAQYTSLMVVRRLRGEQAYERVLSRHQLAYLNFRRVRDHAETPLARIFQMPILAYERGTAVMADVERTIGEARVNQSLADLDATFNLRDHPRRSPRTEDFRQAIYEHVTEPERDRIDADLDTDVYPSSRKRNQ